MPFPIDEKWINVAEQSIGRSLPQSYRIAIAARNGGTVVAMDDDWELHPIFDQSERKRIQRTANHILRETTLMQDWRLWPRDALAIASNGSGDRLILLAEGKSFRPEIYVWKHESGEITRVAGTFAELPEG